MRSVRALLYHRVENLKDDYNNQAISPEKFKKQMQYLKEHYDILSSDMSFEEWFENGKRDAVILTFDDGYYDFYSNVFPILKYFEMPAILFVTTDNIDTYFENWTDNILRTIFSDKNCGQRLVLEDNTFGMAWVLSTQQDKLICYKEIRDIFLHADGEKRKRYIDILEKWAGQLHEGRADRRTLTSEEIYIVSQSKWVMIGAHTCTHPSLKSLRPEEQWDEIKESKNKLEKIIQNKITYFSYPFGTKEYYSKVTIELLKKAGFEKAFTVAYKPITEHTNQYEIPRWPVYDYDENKFANYIKNKVFADR